MHYGERWEFGHQTVEGRYYDLVAQIRTARGGGSPEEAVVYVVRDDLEKRFVVLYGPLNAEYGYYQQAFNYAGRHDQESAMVRAYAQALNYAIQRAERR